MLSWIVLILALAACCVLGMWLSSKIFGRGEALDPMPETEDVKAANRRAVEDGNFGDIQLEVVHRGYRMDQVDALIAQLTGQEEGGQWWQHQSARNPQVLETQSVSDGVAVSSASPYSTTSEQASATTGTSKSEAQPVDRA